MLGDEGNRWRSIYITQYRLKVNTIYIGKSKYYLKQVDIVGESIEDSL